MNFSSKLIITAGIIFLISLSFVIPAYFYNINPKENNVQEENIDTADWFPDPPVGTITVIKPNSSDIWKIENYYEIKWVSTGNFDTVNIILAKDDLLGEPYGISIAWQTPNDGSFIYYMPKELTWGGNDYRVLVSSWNYYYPDYIKGNSEYFTVEGYYPWFDTVVTLTNPISSSSWTGGTTQNIQWTSYGLVIAVRLELYKGGVFLQDIANGAENSGSFAWEIPWDLETGNDYQIKASDAFKSTTYDFSDNFAIIKGTNPIPPIPPFPPFIAPLLPNKNCIWEGGKSYDIYWIGYLCSNSVDITLWKGGAYLEDVVVMTSNDGTYTWSVPIDLIEGNDYSIKCIDHNNPSLQGNSEYFSIVSPPGTSVIPTPTGTNVEIIEPDSGISIIFDNIQESGTTVIVNSTQEPEPPTGFEVVGDYYEISTDAIFTGLITVALPYDETKVKGPERRLKLFHWEDESGWTDITTYVDTANNIVYGEVSSFSTFLIVYPEDITPPTITIEYIEGDLTDGNPGKWDVFAYDDESGINYEKIRVFIDGNLVGTTLGNYDVPKELGTHLISVEVENDNELFPLVAYNNASINITDDDTTPPEISNLSITQNIHNISVSFDTFDYSGISNIVILIDGVLIEPIERINNGASYVFVFENYWILKNKIYEIVISVTDADNDRLDDQLTSFSNGSFEITLKEIYDYVNWQIEDLKGYINENLCSIIKWIMNHKLLLAQKQLIKAYDLIERGLITCALFHDAIAQIFIELSEFKTELLSRLGLIDNENALFIVNSLHNIRNNVVILIGASVGLEQGYNIALIEIDLLNLKDLIENEIRDWHGKCLEILIDLSAANLEMAIFKLSQHTNIESALISAQNLLHLATEKIYRLLNEGKISQDVADILLNKMNQINEGIENLKY